MTLWFRIQLWLHNMTPERAAWMASNSYEPGSFLASYEWREARYKALKENDGRCEACARGKHDLPPGEYLCVDHIKPRATHPWRALDIRNLQVIDTACNHGKGRHDTTDWRHKDHPHRKGNM